MSSTSPYADPVPILGFFNLNGTMASACPPAIAIPGRTSCIVPCVPADACIGSNLCATGYMSKPPYFRCASCATGYYLQGPSCVQCPNSPIALIIGIASVFIVVAMLGYFLNKRGVNIGYISIGVDWAQVRRCWSLMMVFQLLHISLFYIRLLRSSLTPVSSGLHRFASCSTFFLPSILTSRLLLRSAWSLRCPSSRSSLP